ncbi:uncharacterized protein PG986_014206 [Apiospora aurea]|uniref:Uncharacterized protein n=1 Tax=Apiospora aurea TaxID=335848 RepID=A0ABR1PSD3_9PEZI
MSRYPAPERGGGTHTSANTTCPAGHMPVAAGQILSAPGSTKRDVALLQDAPDDPLGLGQAVGAVRLVGNEDREALDTGLAFVVPGDLEDDDHLEAVAV